MEDFFKNKLNDFDQSGDGWDRPDPEVWEKASTRLPLYPPKRMVDWKLLTLTLLGVLILFLGSYMLFMSHQINQLENQLEVADSQLEVVNDQLSSLQETYANEKTKRIFENEKINSNNELVLKQKNQVSSILQKQEKELLYLQKVNQSNTIGLKKEESELAFSKETIISENLINDRGDLVIGEIDSRFDEEGKEVVNDLLSFSGFTNKEPTALSLTPLRQSIFHVKRERVKQEFISLIKPAKKYRKRFEVGVNYSNLWLEVPMKSSFDNLKSISEKEINSTYQTNAKGLHIAYGIGRNLFIKTGLRSANLFVKFPLSSGLIYDKSGEYLDTNGKTVHDFVVTTETPYDEIQDEIRIELQGDDLKPDDGDVLLSDLYKLNDIKYIRVPLGVDYYIGEKKFQWLLQGGMAWNKVQFESQLVDGGLWYKEKEISIAETDKQGLKSTNSQFLSAYFGAGCNYQFAKRWHVRAALIAEKNLSSTGVSWDNTSGTTGVDRSLEMSINFRF